MRITNKDLKHLEWVYERMKYVHNENENYDYMIRFREILDKLHQTSDSELLLSFLRWIDQSPEENAGRSREDLVKDYLNR